MMSNSIHAVRHSTYIHVYFDAIVRIPFLKHFFNVTDSKMFLLKSKFIIREKYEGLQQEIHLNIMNTDTVQFEN